MQLTSTCGVFVRQRKKRKYTDKQLDDLKKLFPFRSNADLEKLIGIPEAAIAAIAHENRLLKDKNYITQQNRGSAASRLKWCVRRPQGWCVTQRQDYSANRIPKVVTTACGDKVKTDLGFKKTYSTCLLCKEKMK